MTDYNQECVACQIQKRQISTQIVYETQHTLCFFSYEPIQAGHTLIIPKDHYPNLIDIPDSVSQELWEVSRCLYQKLEEIYQPDGISLMQNNGLFNDLDHYHRKPL